LKLYTRRGDSGETDLFGGERVSKDHVRVTAYGEVDELNASIGAATAASDQKDLIDSCQRIQSTLFDLGSFLATPNPNRRQKAGIPEPSEDDVAAVEEQIDLLEAELEPLNSFILPGGTRAAAAFHLARTVCRRAERSAVRLDLDEPLGGFSLRYLNRLSDLLFVLARVENRRAGVSDICWAGGGAR
jgi:cob(I)alamin adenosyltransferase